MEWFVVASWLGPQSSARLGIFAKAVAALCAALAIATLQAADIGYSVSEPPFVNGKRHGTQVVRYPDGSVLETPYVNGKRHGTEVERNPNIGIVKVTETPYVNGKRHGTQVERSQHDSGEIITKTPYVEGEKHGTAIMETSNGGLWRTPYVRGKIHGIRFVRYAFGVVVQTPYFEGKKHGTEVRTSEDGTVTEIDWANDNFIACRKTSGGTTVVNNGERRDCGKL